MNRISRVDNSAIRLIWQLLLLKQIGVVAVLLAGGGLLQGENSADRKLPDLPPFLDLFLAPHQAPTETVNVSWQSALGRHQGQLIRPKSSLALPAVVLIASKEAQGDFLVRAAHNFAEVGFTALILPPPDASAKPCGEGARDREVTLDPLSAAVRWLRGRSDVKPGQIGVIGWGGGGFLALELTSAQGLQACVVCDGELPLDASTELLGGLRNGAVLFIRSTADASLLDSERFVRFYQAIDRSDADHRVIEFDRAKPGFMDRDQTGPYDFEIADRAWFEIYEYLGKHVEDAPLKRFRVTASPAGDADSEPLEIADLMRAVFDTKGLRGQLLKSLVSEPKDDKAWNLALSRSAVMAHSVRLLEQKRPEKGSEASWIKYTTTFRKDTETLLVASRHHDLKACLAVLARIKKICGECHLDHR